MEKLFKNKKIKRVVSLLLMLVVLGTSMGLERFVQVIWAQTTYIKIYLKDNTIEHWLGNDNAVMELVDNTSGHIHYRMTKEDSETWSIKVPDTTYNVTFNRLSPDGNTQWNSWSAGGRDSNNVYFADGGEYGHWEVIEDDNEEKYFHAGDIVYLDLTQFVAWKSSDALLYINFTGASKKENNGQDINLSKADKSQYNPKKVDMEVTENIYAYVVGFEDEGSTELRFWRGNNSTLWNCSIILSYDDYVNGVNCVRISNWDNEGSLIETEHKMDTEVDSDGDGLPDYYEYIHNTDIYKADTDGDGLTDYQEINETATNPNMMDTNGDGIIDADEDADGDGLSNIDEYRVGTSNLTVDTDGDGLTDYEEVVIYGTNPNEKDTDGDGAEDEWEIIHNFDPLVYNDTFIVNEIVTGNNTSVDVELIVAGNSAESFEVKLHENDEVYVNSTIPGYLGSGYDFYIDGEFESAKIKYYFNSEECQTEGFNPVVYYYNEDTNELEEIATEWDGTSNFVTAQLPHFSTYLLLDKTKFEEIWDKKIKVDNGENAKLNIAFVVDLSGSMSGSKLTTTKFAINSFLDILEENDRAGLITFTTYSNVISNLTTDISSLKEIVNNMHAYGDTSIYTGLNSAVEMLSNDDESGYDIVIVFTDGYDSLYTTYDADYRSIVDKAVENDICIYTIGIGQVDTGILTKVAETTGGNYYHASVVSELEKKMNEVKEETKELTNDTNGDNITDYHTKMICNCSLRYSIGAAVIGFAGNYEKVQGNADYDDDGLINGDEITIGSTSGGRSCVIMMSNPIDKDTDKDGYTDKEEKRNGTNAFYPDINKNDVDALFKDYYLASVFADDYEENYETKFLLQVGNLITNFKYSYVNDYRKALILYIQQYTGATYQDKLTSAIKATYDSALFDMLEQGTNYVLSFSDVLNQTKYSVDYFAAKQSVVDCCNKIASLRQTVASIQNYSQLAGYDDELVQTFVNIQTQIAEQKELLNSANCEFVNILNEMKLNGKFAEATGKLVNKLPASVVKFINKMGTDKVNSLLTYGIIALDTGISVLDTVSIYGGLDAGFMQCAEIDEFLESIIENSDIKEMREAASDVKKMLEDDSKTMYYGAMSVVADIFTHGFINVGVTYTLTHIGPMGWAAYLGWGLGNLASGTGRVDEKALGIIAYGNGAKCYSESIKEHLSSDTDKFYMCPEELKGQLQLLGQLKVVGEDKFCETAKNRGPFRKFFEWIISGESQASINAYGRENIEEIISKCDNMGIFVEKKFEGNYLYD